VVAFAAPNALIGGDAPADVHPLGGRDQLAAGSRQQAADAAARSPLPAARCSAFTLIEILIVIGIIVLLIAIALPAFNAISGSRSVDAAANTVSAFIGRARLEAIGLQETRGVMFFIDPVSQESKIAIVKAVSRPAGTGSVTPVVLADAYVSSVDLYLDLADDKDLLTIPSGVGIQFVDDCNFTTGANPQRRDDGFLGFNSNYYEGVSDVATPKKGTTLLKVQYGGVILFDSQGKIIVTSYAFKTRAVDEVNVAFYPTAMGRRLFTVTNTDAEERTARATFLNVAHVVPWQTQVNPAAPARPVRSQVGFVLYDKSAFESQQFTTDDPQLADRVYITDPTEPGEETWLDENSTFYLVNRYNGTLVKGE